MSETPVRTNEEPSPHAPHVRTPEQHDAVRRRSLPLSAAGAILGVAGVILLFTKQVGVHHPPNVVAVNMSFCAMMMGVGILFYAKGTPGTGLARGLCIAALAVGLVGPFLFSQQAIAWRKGTEGRELENVAALAQAAKKYASEHAGKYPASVAVMLEEKYLTPEQLLSPFAGTQMLEETVGSLKARMTEKEVLAAIEGHSDFTYAGGDLVAPPTGGLPKEILVAYAKQPVMRKHLAVAYADGSAAFITLEEAEPTLKATNAAREKLGLPELRRPESVEKALKESGAK